MRAIARRRLLISSGTVLALAAWQPRRAMAAGRTLDAIKASGVLRIGTSGNAPPYTGVDFRNQLTGFDIAWGEMFAHALGVKLEWAKIDFRGLMAALQAGQVDMLMSGIRITKEREQVFEFSKPYSYEETVAVVPASDKTITSFAAIAHHDVAVVAGSFQEQIVRHTPGVTSVQALPGASDVFMALRTGHAQVAVLGRTAYTYYTNHHDVDVRVAGTGAQPTPQGAVLPQGADTLKAMLDGVIDKAFADGTYARLYQQYFHMAPPAPPASSQ